MEGGRGGKGRGRERKGEERGMEGGWPPNWGVWMHM